jgi:hypothetical protein
VNIIKRSVSKVFVPSPPPLSSRNLERSKEDNALEMVVVKADEPEEDGADMVEVTFSRPHALSLSLSSFFSKTPYARFLT